MIGKALAHYDITSQLGKRGMGEVFQAKDQKVGWQTILEDEANCLNSGRLLDTPSSRNQGHPELAGRTEEAGSHKMSAT